MTCNFLDLTNLKRKILVFLISDRAWIKDSSKYVLSSTESPPTLTVANGMTRRE